MGCTQSSNIEAIKSPQSISVPINNTEYIIPESESEPVLDDDIYYVRAKKAIENVQLDMDDDDDDTVQTYYMVPDEFSTYKDFLSETEQANPIKSPEIYNNVNHSDQDAYEFEYCLLSEPEQEAKKEAIRSRCQTACYTYATLVCKSEINVIQTREAVRLQLVEFLG